MIVRLKEQERTADIPVIVITGRKISGRRDTALERDLIGRREASAYIEKPIDFDLLLAELLRYVNLVRLPSRKCRAGLC